MKKMHDLTIFTGDQLRKIARAAERETDLFAGATEKFISQYSGRITVEVVEKASKLTETAKEEAQKRGLSEIESYQFRKSFIQKYTVENQTVFC